MSVQINALVLYSNEGRRRIINFRTGRLNIITGDSQTGKTSIIDIVDYCLGRESFTVSDGIVRKYVSWFGIRLQGDSEQIFIGRPAPRGRQKSSSLAYVVRGSTVDIPDYGDLSAITNLDGLLAILSDVIGLEQAPQGTPGLPAFAVTPRHASFLLFQQQDEIINRELLFHRQGEREIAQTLQSVLPYFLGAVDSDDLARLRWAMSLRRDIRRLTQRVRENEQIGDFNGPTAGLLLMEAAAAGLIDVENPEAYSPADARGTLSTLVESPSDYHRPDLAEDDRFEDLRASLLSERSGLRDQYQEIRERLRSVHALAKVKSDFSSELGEQFSRLRSLELVPDSPSRSEDSCPLCGSDVSEISPSLEELRDALGRLSREISVLPRSASTSAVIDRLESAATETRQKLRDNAAALDNLERANTEYSEFLRRQEARASVLGRIQFFLQRTSRLEDQGGAQAELDRLSAMLADVESAVNAETISSRLASIFSRIANYMTSRVGSLSLEYGTDPLRFDLRKLMVIADAADGPVPMNRMGSGANWVGYHVLIHLALHAWFAEHSRPVPSFIVFDQPCQVYFPSDSDLRAATGGESQGDYAAAERLVALLYNAVRDAEGRLQVILTEHADLDAPWFQDSVVERWRSGNALVPTEWIRGDDDSGSEADGGQPRPLPLF